MRISFSTSRSAFTLIEMLVVVAIIAALVAVVTSGYLASRSKARDVNRKDSLSAYRTAIEQYKLSRGSYIVYDGKANPNFDTSKFTFPASCSQAALQNCLLQDAQAQTGQVGYKGGGWGAVTRKGAVTNYQTNSIADALVDGGFLSEIRLDQRVTNFTDFSPTAATYNDFLLTVCTVDGASAGNWSSAVQYALYTNLENAQLQDQTAASHLCAGSNTPKGWDAITPSGGPAASGQPQVLNYGVGSGSW